MSVKENFEKEFCNEEIELLVLMKENCNGAGVYGDMLKPSVEFWASVDVKTGVLSRKTGRIEWMIKNDSKRKGWGYDFKQLGIYHVKVRKCIPKKLEAYQMEVLNNRYMLVEIVNSGAKNAQLEEIKNYYATPVTIENELGIFSLNREFSWFEGEADWNGITVSVFMETDEQDGESAKKAEEALLEFSKNFEELDEKYRLFAAKQLTDLANDWLESDDSGENSEKITEERFAERIEMREITFCSDGELTLYYSDDDMFWGHSIEITVDASGEPLDADMVG